MSPTNWIIGNGTLVHVGDEVVGAEGCRGRIVGVEPKTGYPVVLYETGALRGVRLAIHPFRISDKVRGQ